MDTPMVTRGGCCIHPSLHDCMHTRVGLACPLQRHRPTRRTDPVPLTPPYHGNIGDWIDQNEVPVAEPAEVPKDREKALRLIKGQVEAIKTQANAVVDMTYAILEYIEQELEACSSLTPKPADSAAQP